MTPAAILPSLWVSLAFAGIFIALGLWMGAILWKPEPDPKSEGGFEGAFEGSPICGWCGAPLDPAEAYGPAGIDGPLYCSPAHQMLADLDADAHRRADAWRDDQAIDEHYDDTRSTP